MCPRVKIIYLIACLDVVRATEAMAAGGVAYVLKTSPATDPVIAIREALKGSVFVVPQAREQICVSRHQCSSGSVARPRLTSREREVLRLIAVGRRTKEAAFLLRVSPRTVGFHRCLIADKLRVGSTAE